MGNNGNGFFDGEELKTPEHDKILIWLLNNYKSELSKQLLIEKQGYISFNRERSYDLLRNQTFDLEKGIFNIGLDPAKNDLETDQIKKIKKETEDNFKIFKEEMVEERKKGMIFETPIIEKPMNNMYKEGYFDMYVRVRRNFIQKVANQSASFKMIIDEDKPFIPQIVNDFYFEIKPEVKSIGEVLRQLQRYKNYNNLEYNNWVNKTKYILVTKTESVKKIFEEQGFGVIIYKEEQNEQMPNM